MLDKELFGNTKILIYKLPKEEQAKRFNFKYVGSGKDRVRVPTDEVVGEFDSVAKIKPCGIAHYESIKSLTKDHTDCLHNLTFDANEGLVTIVANGSLVRRIFCLIY
jgi:hypothetical protein